MLAKTIYTGEYIKKLHDETGNDPSLLERVIYAFGLLEAIKKVGLPFCFKGGTALLLLLEHPKRLSTDIDIIVEPGTDIDEYIRRAGEIFPFNKVEENVRISKNNITKRHFRFSYNSPGSGRDVVILLDVLFEKVHYGKTILKPIKNELLMNEGEDLFVTMPDVNGILGDKLTAFAPHTTGIPFGVNKELEIIKQMFDCASLLDAMTDFKEVKTVYESCVKSEAKYRGLAVSSADVLKDTINACFCIASRGICENNDYAYFKDGIYKIRNHILGANFNGETAGSYAAKVMYLAASILTRQETLTKIEDASVYAGEKIELPKPKRFSYMRIVDPLSYAYFVESVKMLKSSGEDFFL